MKTLLVTAAGLMLAGCSASSGSHPTAAPETHMLSGTVTLGALNAGAYSQSDEGKPCEAGGPYSDIQAGLDLVVKDGKGNVLGTGHLEPGTITVHDDCAFKFTIGSVPQSDFYTLTAGKRGAFTYSYADLQSAGWNVDYVIDTGR